MPPRVVFLSLSLVAISGSLAFASKVSFQHSFAGGLKNVYGEQTISTLNMPPEVKLPVDAKIVSQNSSKNGSQVTFKSAEGEESIRKLLLGQLTQNGWDTKNEDKISKGNNRLSLSITPSNAEGLNVVTISYLNNAF